MLTELELENFKCFKERTTIPFSRLNLLTGVNSGGKSTALQPLLLLAQSLLHDGVLPRIELYGSMVRLGQFDEVRNRERRSAEPIRLAFEHEQGPRCGVLRLWLTQQSPEERWANIAAAEVEIDDAGESHRRAEVAQGALTVHAEQKQSRRQSLLLDFRDMPASEGSDWTSVPRWLGHDPLYGLHYVGADRLGPQDFYPRTVSANRLSVGVRGELCAEALHRAQQDPVHEKLIREEGTTVAVLEQAEAWLAHVFGGGALRVSAPYSTILTLELNSDGSAIYMRAPNLGFGYTYALPILVAGLVASPGEILVVENPEAHLHPQAQSRLGEFLAKVSSCGVQVFVESHSEHFLNAFRLAVREQILPDPEALCVLYFDRKAPAPVLRVPVEADGQIPLWPEGFFDQRTKDFLRLFGV